MRLHPAEFGSFDRALVAPEWRWFWERPVPWIGPSRIMAPNGSAGGSFAGPYPSSAGISASRSWLNGPLGPGLAIGASANYNLAADLSELTLPYTVFLAVEVPSLPASISAFFRPGQSNTTGMVLSGVDTPTIRVSHYNTTPAVRSAEFTLPVGSGLLVFSATIRNQAMTGSTGFCNGVRLGAPSLSGTSSGTFNAPTGLVGQIGFIAGTYYIAGITVADWSDERHLQWQADPLGPVMLDLGAASRRGSALFDEGVTEAWALSDASAGALAMTAGLGEAVALAEVAAASLDMGGAVAEQLAGADAPAAVLDMAPALAETLAAAETASGALAMEAQLAEALGVGEAALGGLEMLAGLAEQLDTADAVAATLAMPGAIAEALALTDAAAQVAVMMASIDEAAGLADAPAGVLDMAAQLAETLTGADAIQASQSFDQAVLELVEAVDAEDLTIAMGAVIEEGISLAELMAGGLDIAAFVAEELDIGDEAALALVIVGVLTARIRVRAAIGGGLDTRAKLGAAALRVRAALAARGKIGKD